MKRREAMRFLGGAICLAWSGFSHVAKTAEVPRTSLGIVVYALGLRRKAMKAKRCQGDLFEPAAFLDYCRNLGAGGAQMPLGQLEAAACERLRASAEAYGMFLEGISDPPYRDEDLQRFEAEIRTAARVGARAVRTVIIPGRRYEQFASLEEFRQFADRGKRALERAAPIVERYGLRLAVENHKDQRIDERLDLLRHLGSEYIGACVDTGNSLALLEDPVAAVEALAPHAFSVHLKDQAVCEYEQGFLLADVPLGEGCLDLKKMTAMLRRAKPDVQFCLETITRDPLQVPCLTADYWRTLPDVPAADLARTLRMVRVQTSADLPKVSSLPLEEQAELELATVRRCLDYARTELGL